MKRQLQIAVLGVLAFLLIAMDWESLGERIGEGRSGNNYRVNITSQLEPNLTLERINVGRRETTLRFSYRNRSRDYYDEIAIYPPDHRNAFYLTDIEEQKRYELVSVEGIALDPDFDEVRAGREQEFTLIFEPLDRGVGSFHLIEGGTERERDYHWNFYGVDLDRRR